MRRNPFYSGLLFDSIEESILYAGVKTVAIPSIQVCCLIRLDITWRWSTCIGRNPFYSGLLFDSPDTYSKSTFSDMCRNPFYSGLLFDSAQNVKEWVTHCIWSQSLLFRSAVWFNVLDKMRISDMREVAIPSIQVCCLIRHTSNYFRAVRLCVAIPSIQVCCLIQAISNISQLWRAKSRNPFYSGLLFDSGSISWWLYSSWNRSQSLLFRSAVWFKGACVKANTEAISVAIPSIQVCCLIHVFAGHPVRIDDICLNPFWLIGIFK